MCCRKMEAALILQCLLLLYYNIHTHILKYINIVNFQLTYKVTQHWIKSSNKMVPRPNLSNFWTMISTTSSDNLYPNAVSAFFNSTLSMFPELSLSNDRKQFCQSVTYFHRAPKSSKDITPLFCLSNIPRKKDIN